MKKRVIFSGIVGILIIGILLFVGYVVFRFIAAADLLIEASSQGSGLIIPALSGSSGLETIIVYKQEYSMDFGRDNLLVTIDNSEQLAQWHSTLTKCVSHRPNHPRYNEVYLVIASHAESKYYFMLRVDQNDNNHVDLVPFEEIESDGNVVRIEQGNYRCEGLKALVENLPN